MISHETKRILGTTGLLFIVALLVARALPLPLSSFGPGTRPSSTGHRLPPALIFADNVSLFFGGRAFNLSLTGSHQYMWKFNVTYGSMMINLTDPVSHAVIWSVGPRSSGSQYLNGIGVANFNWTAPMTGYYPLSFQSLSSSSWTLSSSFSLLSVCYAQVLDPQPLAVVFNFRASMALPGE